MLRKCSGCKMLIPEKVMVCPICGKEYTQFEHFKTKILWKLILGIVLLVLLYNLIIIISFNRVIRNFVEEYPQTDIKIEEIEQKYQKRNAFQKMLIRYDEIENFFVTNGEGNTTYADLSKNVVLNTQKGSVEASYKGELVDDVPNGAGEAKYIDENGVGCTYNGEFENGKITGFGILQKDNKECIKGEFFDGYLNGYGAKFNSDGLLIQRGNFVNNLLHGAGIMNDDKGNLIYEGEFFYGKPEKEGYKNSCITVTDDMLGSNTINNVNVNLCINGILTDMKISGNFVKEYIFTPSKADERFCVVFDGENPSQLQLSKNYTIYGYCTGTVQIDTDNGPVLGMKITAYYVN